MTTIAPALANRYFPQVHPRVKDLLLVLSGSLLVAAFAQIRIPLPYTPVPLTGQTFAVLLVGAALGSRRGVASLALYIAFGAAGVPFFAGGASGLSYLAGPTFGYLVGFVAAAFLTGWLAERGMERSLKTSLVPFAVGTLAIYACGAGWLALNLGLPEALALGVLPFLIGDAIKLIAAALVLPAAWQIVR